MIIKKEEEKAEEKLVGGVVGPTTISWLKMDYTHRHFLPSFHFHFLSKSNLQIPSKLLTLLQCLKEKSLAISCWKVSTSFAQLSYKVGTKSGDTTHVAHTFCSDEELFSSKPNFSKNFYAIAFTALVRCLCSVFSNEQVSVQSIFLRIGMQVTNNQSVRNVQWEKIKIRMTLKSL